MKKILPRLFVLLLCICIIPMSVFAAEDAFMDKFFPGGETGSFGKSYVDVITNEGHSTVVYAYTPIADILNEMAIYVDTADDFTKEFGLTSEPYVYYQCDIAVDNPDGWLMQPDWNWDKPEEFTYNGSYDCATTCDGFTPSGKIENHTIIDLYFEKAREQLEGIYITGADEYGEPIYKLDTNNHTIYFRFRYVICYEYENDYGNWHRLISPWSEVTAVGKNTNQQPLTEPTGFEAPVISNLVVVPPDEYGSQAHIKYDVTFPESLYNAYIWYNVHANWTDIGDIQGQINVDGKGWVDLYIGNAGRIYDGERATSSTELLTEESHVQWRVRWANDSFASPWSNVLEVNAPKWETSPWASEEIEKADELGLIPEILNEADLTKPITRAEFAAVSVKAYEALSGVSAIPAVNNPFTDTYDVEVLKAYNTGIIAGVSATKFNPDALLNREQAATMLTRVFKKVSLAGWSLAEDSKFTLPFEKPAAFADDKDISDWARDSVYFMTANKIINGVGNNKFAPKNITTEDEATGYANATREQALIIAVRMVENLKK